MNSVWAIEAFSVGGIHNRGILQAHVRADFYKSRIFYPLKSLLFAVYSIASGVNLEKKGYLIIELG